MLRSQCQTKTYKASSLICVNCFPKKYTIFSITTLLFQCLIMIYIKKCSASREKCCLIIAGHRHWVEGDAAGIGIPASCILVRYRSITEPDWVPLFRYRTGSGIHIFVHSATRLTGCRTVQHLKKGYILHVHTAVGGNEYTLHVHRQLIMVLSGTAGHGLVRHYPAMCSMFSYLWELLNPQGPPDEIVSWSCECSRSQRGTADPSLWISPASVFR